MLYSHVNIRAYMIMQIVFSRPGNVGVLGNPYKGFPSAYRHLLWYLPSSILRGDITEIINCFTYSSLSACFIQMYLVVAVIRFKLGSSTTLDFVFILLFNQWEVFSFAILYTIAIYRCRNQVINSSGEVIKLWHEVVIKQLEKYWLGLFFINMQTDTSPFFITIITI